ncbi:hypothetical protein [Kutzneria sp. NPDC052558]|uniref:hypothetical protein n=1 Tax=Kutzneria sp. NPDC052558 TaxID=3364121 RepID=UPI0037CB253C
MGKTWPRRWSAAVVAVLCLLVGLSSNSGAAVPSAASAYFVDQNGTVTAFVDSDNGATTIPVGSQKIAPPGAPITAVRTAGGLSAFTVGNDGTVLKTCPTQGTVPVTDPGAAPRGAKLVAAAADGKLRLAIGGQPGFTLFMEVIDPCGTTGPKPPPAKIIVPWAPPGGDFAMATLTDGRTMLAAIDVDGALHVLWVSPTGALSDAVLSATGVATPGEPIAVTPKSDATPDTLLLFYTGLDGRVYEVRPAAPGTPVPHPAAGDAPAGARLAAATGPAGNFVAYVSKSGAVTVLPSDPTGGWQPGFQATATGIAPAGAGIAGTAAFDDDFYCGNGPRPVKIKVGPHGPGPGAVWPAGPPNMVGPTTEFAA